MANSSILPISRTLSGATTPTQSGPGRDGNEGVLRISEASPSDRFVSYPGQPLEGGSYSISEIHSVYSTTPADWTDDFLR